MADEAVKFGATTPMSLTGKPAPPDKKVYGVTLATVINNFDCTNEARVQLMLPWLPGYTPWARLSTPMGGLGRGTYWVPQPGEEVLVAFNQGDVREPFVLGSCWNTVDRPPAVSPTDAVTKRKIRTPLGHELAFDEALQSVTLSSNTFGTVTLDPTQATLSTPSARVTVGMDGSITINAATKLTLNAVDIDITAKRALTLRGGASVTVQSAGPCAVNGAPVKLNCTP